ncbi:MULTISPECIES: hypothetical protein [Sorangium]|uniref:Uncharacterized protein n=1 Tax=Sorangium cellulosum TaxID=56 RepID=A0A4P2QLW8_SORCE|nr:MULTISPECIES: hypothetical protein [Sorangium]AUX30493.1 uncharacterized protein SOCE836_025990 [Sorangium cellulosum]WCQ89887.1 hypothetical protein NQZ70_02585 [Sorangium sp. Soce836]
MGPIVIEDAALNQGPLLVKSWCTPVRVWVRAQKTDRGRAYDGEGYKLHCRWVLPRRGPLAVEAIAAPAERVELWSDCGAYYLPTGGDLFLKGGRGRWKVEVWAAEDEAGAWIEPQSFWLTHFYEKGQEVRFPPFANRFRLISGEMTVGDYALTPNVICPVSLAPESEIEVQGYWQSGTLL